MATDPKIVDLSALKHGDENNSVIVRATRKWDGKNTKANTIVQTNVILLDKEADHVLGIIQPPHREQFYDLLEEGHVYNISKFTVGPSPHKWKTVRGPLAITFGSQTNVVPHTDDGSIPKYKFELMPFRDIPTRVDNVTQLLDIVGCLKSMTGIETVSKGLRKMDIIVTNGSGDEATIVFWETTADSFLKEYSKHKSERFVIIVVTSVVVKQFNGKKRIATTPGTKFYLNIDAQEVSELREELEITDPLDEGVQLIPARVQPTYEELIAHNRMTIVQLLSAAIPPGEESLLCTCEATIVDIVDGAGWFYNACVSCLKKMKVSATNLYCGDCAGSPEDYTQRFKILARARDPSGKATFVLFNSDTERLLGVSVDQIMQDHKESESLNTIPPILRNLQGMSRIFQLKLTSYNTENASSTFTVSRVFQTDKKTQKRSLLMLGGRDGSDDAGPSSVKAKIKIEKD